MKKRKSTLFRTAAIGFTAVATSLMIGMTAACANSEGSTEKEEDKTTTKVDNQLVKNGNFEFYSDNKGLYPISSPDSWSGGTSGNSSSSMSGVINTKMERWNYIASNELAEELEANDDLSSSDSNKKNYNGALKDDLPYKNTHDAVKTDATDAEQEFIDNPFTHEYRYEVEEKDGEKTAVYYNSKCEKVTTYKDEDGKLYLDEELKTPFETSVLMLHNYRSGSTDFKGTESYYNSSTTLTLEASTAAKISVWVKTAELYFDGADAKRTPVDCERGAYIKVNTKVGGNEIDSFAIENINTDKLNAAPTKTMDDKEVIDYENWENNGWVQYTVFVEASTFADTTVTVSLGLGKNSIYTVEGYAFFDDVEFTHYLNSAEMADENPEFTSEIRDEKDGDREVNVSHPLSPDAKTTFRVDKKTYTTNNPDGTLNNDKVDLNNSADKYFSINLASTEADSLVIDNPAAENGLTVEGGLTVEETTGGKFVSAIPQMGKDYTTAGITDVSAPEGVRLPTGMRKGDGIDVSDDLIATTSIDDDENWSFGLAKDANYNTMLTKALASAVKLPNPDVDATSTSALVMLSARGAAYEATLTNPKFTLADDSYALISFWIKTSDMDGKTAATVKVVADYDKTNVSSFTVDSTKQSKVDIGDNKDVYDGWVKCFVRVSNNSKAEKTFKIVVNFGNTTISGTTVNSYKAGWLAVTNMSVMMLDQDVYGYSSSASHTASLSFTETTPDTSHKFDTPLGDENVIKTNLAIPSSYTGVNGASKHVLTDSEATGTYNETNSNEYAGLLNKENFIAGKYDYLKNDKSWFSMITALKDLDDKEGVWHEVFGDYCVQPLIIVNSVRKFGEEQAKLYSYGYIGDSTSVNTNAYSAISVRVKASEGAVANIYLVEGKSGGADVLSYDLPEYNFWYDDDGNILREEPPKNATPAQIKELIAYKLREDGLYESVDKSDTKLYANFYNLKRYYDISFEHEKFYKDGAEVKFEDLVQGEIYYADETETKFAPHHLIVGDNSNDKVYEYRDGKGNDLSYYYMEYKDGSVVKSKVVYGIDTSIYRYHNEADKAIPYSFTIDTNVNPEFANEWVTVTFYVHTGNLSKNYRLELWSGSRDSETYAGDDGSYVIFDYSSISLDQSKFEGLRDEYANAIIDEYRKAPGALANNDGNIADFEREAEEKVTLYDYEATYYTFSLYDAEDFRPFNAETAENGETGYSYTYSENTESLAVLKINDAENLSMSAFIDYSVTDKEHETIGTPSVPDDTTSTPSTDDDNNTVNAWLLAASIALIVAIFVAIAAIFIRDFVKKHGHKKTSGKNSYNFNKNKRYVKKYVKANGEAPEIAEGEVDESLLNDKPAEVEVEEPKTEETVEETPAEDKVEEAPAEETPSSDEEEKPADDGKEE